tara:strand:+ start:2017 stop:2280 length:264 start_codon:yes stop_codon:yes gene_type:complete
MIIDALRKKYEYEIAAAKANIDAYRKNATGIGEHPDLVDAVSGEVSKLESAKSKLECLDTEYPAVAQQLLKEDEGQVELDLGESNGC